MWLHSWTYHQLYLPHCIRRYRQIAADIQIGNVKLDASSFTLLFLERGHGTFVLSLSLGQFGACIDVLLVLLLEVRVRGRDLFNHLLRRLRNVVTPLGASTSNGLSRLGDDVLGLPVRKCACTGRQRVIAIFGHGREGTCAPAEPRPYRPS